MQEHEDRKALTWAVPTGRGNCCARQRRAS